MNSSSKILNRYLPMTRPSKPNVAQLYWCFSHRLEDVSMVEKQVESGLVLVQQYRGVMAMIQQNYTRRTATNRFYISIGSGLLVFLTYAVNPSVELEIQSGAATMVAVIGLVLCLVWGLQIRALRGLIDIQIKLAQEMEKELSFNFFQRQKESLDLPGGWLKYGVVEQGLPLLMSLPFLLILAVVNFYQ